MRISPLLLILPALAFAHDPIERLQTSHLEAVHAQRVEWLKKRAAAAPPAGVYQDYRAILNVRAQLTGDAAEILAAAKADGVNIVMLADHHGPKTDSPFGLRDGVLFIPASEDDAHAMAIYSAQADSGVHQEFYDRFHKAMKQPLDRRRLIADFKAYPDEFYAAGTGVFPQLISRWDETIFPRRLTGIAANDGSETRIFNGVTFDPDAVAFRFVSTHILARDLTEPQIRESLAAGRAYVAFDWLCDPAGFSFTAQNNLGVFDMGDTVELMKGTRLEARLPIAAKIKLIHGNAIVAEANDSKFSFTVKDPGAYRLEAWLTVDGEDRPWIFSNPIFTNTYIPFDPLPPIPGPPTIDIAKDISYVEGDPADAAKHKLDLYLPKGPARFPVMVFYHGGSWRSGDRSIYALLGNRFAKAGIGVAIPSYRLMPKAPHPAQIEDSAAAFAWVYKNIDSYGGDPSRIYAVGHSAGGHLVALLALDPQYLKKLDIPKAAIHGVAALSGVYDVSRTGVFDDHGLDASPMQHLHPDTPPFLITYCQWDYAELPRQARDFAAALKSKFVSAKLVYIAGESHISEIVDVIKDGDPTANALLDFIK